MTTILKLMKVRWTAADEAERLTLQTVALTLRLVTAQRHARDAADALADALAKESSARLVTIMRLEHPPKRRAKKG
jgi:hypothetical protein